MQMAICNAVKAQKTSHYKVWYILELSQKIHYSSILIIRKYSLKANQFQNSFHSKPLKYAQVCIWSKNRNNTIYRQWSIFGKNSCSRVWSLRLALNILLFRDCQTFFTVPTGHLYNYQGHSMHRSAQNARFRSHWWNEIDIKTFGSACSCGHHICTSALLLCSAQRSFGHQDACSLINNKNYSIKFEILRVSIALSFRSFCMETNSKQSKVGGEMVHNSLTDTILLDFSSYTHRIFTRN